MWLTGCALAAVAAGHWIRYRLAHGPAQLAGFLLVGPLQEELLFRGAIYELAARSRLGGRPRAPILISTAFFALHHLQLHGFALAPAALAPVGFAIPMGIVFGALRAESETLAGIRGSRPDEPPGGVWNVAEAARQEAAVLRMICRGPPLGGARTLLTPWPPSR